MVLKVAGKTIWLKYRFSCLSKLEDKLIAHLTDHDFSELNAADLVETAVSIENLVAMQRDILNDVHELGTEIRVWWKRSIEKLTEQTEHLESIAESFRFAADPEATALLALAAEHLAVR
ncbi:MAG: hypothetical protein DMG65_12205 [Candidatus Angelobacter sp. Gp1-AA117]|nr:MAG: hypothetical protein DMG65_12205 [Candidatus Angelobacter sp. Gp1-AA117]